MASRNQTFFALYSKFWTLYNQVISKYDQRKLKASLIGDVSPIYPIISQHLSRRFDLAPDRTMRTRPSAEFVSLGKELRSGKEMVQRSVSSVKDLRIACILDDFTAKTFDLACTTMHLTSQSWREEMVEFRPDLLFVEAAWHGKNDTWRKKLSIVSADLLDLLRWCRENGIPTVFWNKDDPPHYATFINTACLFDHVFTSDMDLIGSYKDALGHENVFFMPFWAEPLMHNPLEKYERVPGFCFAGTYYAKYPERGRDFKAFVNALVKLGPVDIFDRNEYAGNPNYSYPEEFRPYIRGSLPYDQIDRAYKGYVFGINMNSIKDSQAMCARRSYELLASNTVVLSNYSRAIRNIFGDLIVSTDDPDLLTERVDFLLEDELAMDRLKLAGLRHVLLNHTTEVRLVYLVEKVFGKKLPSVMPRVAVLAAVKDSEQAERIVKSFEGQTYADKTLFLIARSDLGVKRGDAIKLLIGEGVGDELIEAVRDFDLVGSFIIDDGYGLNYLTDLVLASKFSQTEGFSKSVRGSLIDASNAPYMISDVCRLNCGLVRPYLLGKEGMERLVRGDPVSVVCKTTVIDAFNYAPNGEPLKEGAFDSGVPMEKMLRASETIPPGSLVNLPRSRVLVVTPQYPSYDNVYRYVFVHRRLKAYALQGLKVDVFRIGDHHKKGYSEFDGIEIQSGDQEDLDRVLSDGQYSTVLVHFLNEDTWNALRDRPGLKKIVVWVHGAEIQPWHRRDFNYRNANERRRAKKQSERRTEFWRGLLTNIPSNLHFVFVSNYLRNEVSEDLGLAIPDDKVSIIPNYVDQNKFSYQEKDPEMRKRILSIRPFSSNKYGNDLTVKAILELSKKSYFNELDFLIVGDGELFAETVKAIRDFKNVKLLNRHLSEKEYREIFKDYGVFLCPTRWDSQGVSRDEAMSCGLVTITNKIAAIPEFVSDNDAFLVPAEDYISLANAVDLLYNNPSLFKKMSMNGPMTVSKKSNYGETIEREKQMIQQV